MAHGHAAPAQNALVGIAHQGRRRQIEGMILLDAAVATLTHSQLARDLRQLAVLIARTHQTVIGVIGNQQFDDVATNRLHARRTRAHLLPVLGFQRAARLQPRHAFQFHQTHTTGRLGLARPIHRAQMGDGDPCPQSGR